MLVYVYAADIVCGDCGEAIRADLTAKGKAPEDPSDEGDYDSDDFPKGPTEEGKSDTPSHCGACGVFLESTLTDEGAAYVIATVKRDRTEGRAFTPHKDVPVSQLYGGPGQYSCPSAEWAAYYDDLDFGDEDEEDDSEDEDEESVECSICGMVHNDDNHTHQ